MRTYVQAYDPKVGPYLEIFLSKPASIYEDEDVNISRHKLNMLLDTGASRTAINPVIANKIGLQPMGKHPLRSATGEVSANIYYADLTCEFCSPHFYMSDIPIIGFPMADGWIDGFIGRDFFEKIVFDLNGPKKEFKITF